MSRLGDLYQRVYDAICGVPPALRLPHFQWLAARELLRDMRSTLATLGGRIVDVGCGDQPYRKWFRRVDSYTGLDVYAGPHVDVVIDGVSAWPLESASADVVVCTQVLEHVPDLQRTYSEITRILRPGGTLVLSVPFLYNEHGAPADYRRFSVHGVEMLLAEEFDVQATKVQGRVASTTAILLLNWMEIAWNSNKVTRFAKALLLPLWLLFSTSVNICAFVIDLLDRTRAIYHNVLVVARRKGAVIDEQ